MVESDKCQMFDYGRIGNMIKYNQVSTVKPANTLLEPKRHSLRCRALLVHAD